MAVSKKQKELDVAKWLKSEEMGRDMCGEFDFCAVCDKSVQNPCAKAYDLYTKNGAAPQKKILKEKPVAAKAARKKVAESISGKTPARKTAAGKPKKTS